jgi:ADP-heptose:LPS heptosyltransferase
MAKKDEKYCIFHVQGGLGKHIAASAVCKAIKNNYPDRKLILVCVYTDAFKNLPYIDRVFPLGNTQYFYQTYIDGKDSLIFANEPYYTTTHIHKQLPLVQTWCKMYGLEYNGETPDFRFNGLQKKVSKEVWKTQHGKKPVMILHTNGGLITPDAKPFMWARDMPIDVAQQIFDRYRKDFTIYQCTKVNSPKIDGANIIEFGFNQGDMQLNLIEFLSVLIHSDVRILIDSCMQHAAAALKLPSMVLWNGTSPKVFGYDMHTNLETVMPNDFKLPNSYLFDFDFNGDEFEYPYDDTEDLYDMEKIFEYIDSQYERTTKNPSMPITKHNKQKKGFSVKAL